jgi:hypothetical protein
MTPALLGGVQYKINWLVFKTWFNFFKQGGGNTIPFGLIQLKFDDIWPAAVCLLYFCAESYVITIAVVFCRSRQQAKKTRTLEIIWRAVFGRSAAGFNEIICAEETSFLCINMGDTWFMYSYFCLWFTLLLFIRRVKKKEREIEIDEYMTNLHPKLKLNKERWVKENNNKKKGRVIDPYVTGHNTQTHSKYPKAEIYRRRRISELFWV